MRSYRHEARKELIGKIRGPGLRDYRVKAHFLFEIMEVEVGGEIVLFGKICVWLQ